MARSLRELTGTTGSIEEKFDSLVPDLSDVADITEAFRAYHFGISNYTSSSGSPLGIVGAFEGHESRIDSIESTLTTIPNTANLLTKTGNNVMLPSSASVVPISITAAASKSANLIEFKNSSSTTISLIDFAGRFSGQATGIIMQGDQALTSRVRNITVSTSTPTSGDGSNGDIWVKF
jgi:hypothetical protein